MEKMGKKEKGYEQSLFYSEGCFIETNDLVETQPSQPIIIS